MNILDLSVNSFSREIPQKHRDYNFSTLCVFKKREAKGVSTQFLLDASIPGIGIVPFTAILDRNTLQTNDFCQNSSSKKEKGTILSS